MTKRRKVRPAMEPEDIPTFGHDPAYHDVPFIPYIDRAKSEKITVGMAKTVFNSMAKAKMMHDGKEVPNTRIRKKWKKDKCTTSKNILKNGPTIAWARNTGIGDVPGIDAPGQCSTRIVKGRRVTTCAIPKGSKYAKVCSPKKRKSKGKKR